MAPAMKNIWASLSAIFAAGNFNNLQNTNLDGLGLVRSAKFTYDFAVDGGAVATIIPTNSPLIPANAIILGGIMDVVTAVLGAGASVSVGTSAGSSATSIVNTAAISGAPWSTTGLKAIIPVFTAATMVKMTAAGKLTLTVTAAVLTAGKFNVNVLYVIGGA